MIALQFTPITWVAVTMLYSSIYATGPSPTIHLWDDLRCRILGSRWRNTSRVFWCRLTFHLRSRTRQASTATTPALPALRGIHRQHRPVGRGRGRPCEWSRFAARCPADPRARANEPGFSEYLAGYVAGCVLLSNYSLYFIMNHGPVSLYWECFFVTSCDQCGGVFPLVMWRSFWAHINLCCWDWDWEAGPNLHLLNAIFNFRICSNANANANATLRAYKTWTLEVSAWLHCV